MPPRNALGPDNRLFPDAAPTLADAWSHNASAYSDWLAQQRASGVQAGMIDPATIPRHPTPTRHSKGSP